MSRPNVLLIMTDEERYPPPYESESVTRFRQTQLTARERLRDGAVEFHRHYAGSTACVASRATLFTGQYPSLHGVSQTDGMAKKATDAAMSWLDPDTVPTLGDWFRAGGYRTHYRGKWHISHADLLIPGGHTGLMAVDDDATVLADSVAAYRHADRLDPFGFSGWIGREPHGAAKSDCGKVRDGVFAEQVVELFDDLAASRGDGPWLAVASFVNPHDISFGTTFWEQFLGFDLPTDVPDIAAAPSQADSFDGRPRCHEQFKAAWPAMTYEQPTDETYRRLYYHLHLLVDRAIGRILDALETSGMAEDTIVVFTSDHGDLLGAHGGLMQKWYNAFDEAIRVPFTVRGPGVAARPGGVSIPTSHVDLLPTLLGLAGVDIEAAAAGVSAHHIETHTFVGRDLSGLITGTASAESVDAPVYFMTDDDVTRGSSQQNILTGAPYDAVEAPSRVEAVITHLPTGADGSDELWKLNHYFERLDDWEAANGLPADPYASPSAEPFIEVHNLSVDPEERRNRSADEPEAVAQLLGVLDRERDRKRRLPSHRNPTG